MCIQVADGTRKKMLRTSDGGFTRQQRPLPVPQQQLPAFACWCPTYCSQLREGVPSATASVQESKDGEAAPGTTTTTLDKDSAWQKLGKQPAAARLPLEDLMYSESHDSCGRMTSYINRGRGSSFTGHVPQQQQQQEHVAAWAGVR